MTRLLDLVTRLRPVVEGSFGGALLDELEAEITHAQEGEGIVLGLNDALRDEVGVLRAGLEALAATDEPDGVVVYRALRALLDEHDAMVAERPPWRDVGHRTEAL